MHDAIPYNTILKGLKVQICVIHHFSGTIPSTFLLFKSATTQNRHSGEQEEEKKTQIQMRSL